jgi:hypothetical protein
MSTHLILGRALAEIAGTLFPITRAKGKRQHMHDAMHHVQVVRTESGALRFVATDGHRLVVQDVDPITNVTFPRWQEVIPDSKNEIGHITIEPDVALRLAKTLHTADPKGDKPPAVLRISCTLGQLNITHELGSTSVSITGRYDHELFINQPMAVNHAYLADALQDALSLERTPQPVTIRFYGPTGWHHRPILVESTSESARTFTVLMPVLHHR